MQAVAGVILIALGFVLLGLGIGDHPARMAAGAACLVVGFLLARRYRKS